MRPHILWLALLVAGVVFTFSPCQAAEVTHDPAQNPPAPAIYLRLANEVETHLKTGVLAVWFPRCVDSVHGGFTPNFREDWTRGNANDKFLVFQARMTWVTAQIAERHPDFGPQYRQWALHGLDFLDKTMWDQQNGGFFWGLDESGKITPSYGTEKHAYGIGFGIYAAAAVYAATKEPRALDLATRAFHWLDLHAHDNVNGGYYEALTREGKPILAADPATPTKTTDGIGALYGYKSMNSHIHLLEALTELYGVWPDKQLGQRLREMFLIVRDKIAVEPGCLNLYFTPDWKPVPDHDSFGHDIETAYLLIEAATTLGEPNEARTMTVARHLVDHALAWGWDDTYGGFYDKGAAFTAAYGLDKVWWTQAEGLNALLLMHERFGDQTPRYFNAFLKQWDFIWNHQIDHRYGEWYESVSREGVAKAGMDKGQIWKAAYHNGRALLNVSARLRVLAGGGK